MISVVLEVIGGAVVLEIAVQAAWHLGLRRFWRPDPKRERCPKLIQYKGGLASGRCELEYGHFGPHEHQHEDYQKAYVENTADLDSEKP